MKRENSQSVSKVPDVAKSNIKAIMEIELSYLRQRSLADRLSDRISTFAGTVAFFVANILGFATWVAANTGVIPGIVAFDPYPFGLLSLFLSFEVIFLSTFVLMSQNRQTRQADHWAHLDLQIGLLAEQETTKILTILKAVCSHLGLDSQVGDDELGQMMDKTSVGTLAEELAENLEKTRDSEKPLPGGR
jgi:uncharacterized membrane protein